MTTKNGSPSYFFSESKLRNRYHNFAILSLMYFSVWGIFKTYIYKHKYKHKYPNHNIC